MFTTIKLCEHAWSSSQNDASHDCSSGRPGCAECRTKQPHTSNARPKRDTIERCRDGRHQRWIICDIRCNPLYVYRCLEVGAAGAGCHIGRHSLVSVASQVDAGAVVGMNSLVTGRRIGRLRDRDNYDTARKPDHPNAVMVIMITVVWITSYPLKFASCHFVPTRRRPVPDNANPASHDHAAACSKIQKTLSKSQTETRRASTQDD
eukprot:2750627-Rhodomonas_salina.3